MSLGKRALRSWMMAPVLACGVLVGCGDDDDNNGGTNGQPDASWPTGSDAGRDGGVLNVGDAGMDGGAVGSLIDAGSTLLDATVPATKSDAATDASAPLPPQLAPALAKVASISPDQNDRFASVAFGPDGKIYAAGFVQTVAAGVTDSKMIVARYGVDGALDGTFGTAGVATLNVNVAAVGADDKVEAARGIAVQPDGKIVIAGNVPRGKATVGTASVDQIDIAVARLTSAGLPDATFSPAGDDGDGVAVFSLGGAVEYTPPMTGTTAPMPRVINDTADGVAVDALGRVVVFGSGDAEAESANDPDRFIVRLTALGALDTTFAGDGKYSSDPSGKKLSDNAKPGHILAGNKVFSPGYTNIDGKNTIVLLQLTEAGEPDVTFDTDGSLVVNPLGPNGWAEAYGAARQGTNFVTIGYGDDTGLPMPVAKVVSFRFAASGARDTSYGTQGNVVEDFQAHADQGRSIVALPDNRLLVVGNSNTASGVTDGLVLLLDANGQRDPSFDLDGWKAYDFGKVGEQFVSVAVSADGKYAAAVGYSGAGAMMDATYDSALWIQKL